MKRGKMTRMVAIAPSPKRGRGRPKLAEGQSSYSGVILPDDLRRAVEKYQHGQRMSSFSDALRQLVRESAEARGLVDPREALS